MNKLASAILEKDFIKRYKQENKLARRFNRAANDVVCQSAMIGAGKEEQKAIASVLAIKFE